MDYSECMNHMKNISIEYGISMGLDNMKKLLDYYNHPEKSFKVIHIAGTNGKGSVGTFLSCILSSSGYSVGRYVSPSVTSYNEKIQFTDKYSGIKKIAEEEIAEYISDITGTGIRASVFEIETMMALLSFRDKKCDYVIIECGMGGRDDATNAFDDKELCIFTPIALDHTAYLGNTLSEIADNKSDILRQGIRAVSSPQSKEVLDVFNNKQKKYNTVFVYSQKAQITSLTQDGTVFVYKGSEYRIPTAAVYQVENAALAIEAAKTADSNITDDIINTGLAKSYWPGRFEIISKKPLVIFDGAHNPQGIAALLESINTLFDRKKYKRRAFFGVFADKDTDMMIKMIVNEFDEIHTVNAAKPRGIGAKELADFISSGYGKKAYSHPEKNPMQIVNEISIQDNNKDNVVNIIFGSLSLYNQF